MGPLQLKGRKLKKFLNLLLYANYVFYVKISTDLTLTQFLIFFEFPSFLLQRSHIFKYIYKTSYPFICQLNGSVVHGTCPAKILMSRTCPGHVPSNVPSKKLSKITNNKIIKNLNDHISVNINARDMK